ncbi:Nuclear receptor corepressor 1 [Melia azedarach]|uniref:Nuclear receptor corepressor 1 n=1 Tax=Melia azedarach TaxID=155640 RepID=A0ACC1YDX4_MELAZ|nr:Nuclear receptor corepressor 1 [Melia azedarach]
MPPEPLPWDRKDFFKERKHHNNSHHQNDRSSEPLLGVGGGGGGALPRWRDYYSSSHHSREFPRWGSADFRRPPGDKMLEDESTRIPVSRGDGKYGRNSRENRSSFSQRDWKGHSWDTSNGSSNTPGRLHDVNCDQRSVDDMLTYPSHPQSDFVNTWDHLQLKDQHDNKMGGVNGLGTGQRCERESSLDWKPLKWTRSGSLSSRGSGLSHSSSSKSMGGVDSSEGKTDLQPKNATPVQSPSGDAAAYLTSGAPSDETTSRKKPRLGWGEGLAKYEKKKVDGPDVSVIKDVACISASTAEPVHSLSSNLAEKSPRIAGFSDCASPATPSSVACSSSPGVEEKAFGKAANVDNDVSNLCGSPSIGSQNHSDELLFNLEKLDSDLLANLGSSLIELLQSDDPSMLDSSFVRATAVNKLLLWKGNLLKTLEMTESEIDSLENELKLLKSALGSTSPCPATSSSLSMDENANHFKEQGNLSNSVTRPAPLQIDSCGDASVEKMPGCGDVLEEIHTNVKDEDIDSPGTATSKFVEPLSSGKPVSPSDVLKNVESSGVVDAIQSTNIEVKCTVPGAFREEMTGVSACCEDGSILKENKNEQPGSNDYSVFANGENICDIIFGSNKESAEHASEVFNKLLPRDLHRIDISGVANVLCCQNDSLIKQKFVKRKQFLRFKERVLTLKFKAFQHLWKEDLRLLAIRKYRAKSQKKSESSLRTTYNGYQKHRSSIRSRFSSPAAGSLSLVPTMEIVNFASKLLCDSQVKAYRDSLKMPSLILDNREKMVSRFISNNGLVEDPCAVEQERAMINPWTPEEREIFMDKLATFGKDFRKIASFLDYKTTADCVEFYYKNHKSDSFEKLKKQHDFSKQGKTSTNTYLVTSGKRNRKMNAASLDILGEASELAAAAQVDNCQLISSGRISLGGSDSKISLGDDGIIERTSSFDVVGSERETAAADVLAGICGSLSSEAMSSCITSSVDPGEGQREWRHQKVESVMRRPSTSDVTQNVDDDTCSDESGGEMDPSDWTDEEKSIFIQAVSSYGKDFSMIARCVRTRSRDQCKVFFSKARKCLGLDLIHTGRGNVGTSVNDDGNGGGSDTEDACVLETSSAICSGKLDSKMDEDLPTHPMNINQDESDPAGVMSLQTELNKSEGVNGAEVLDDKDSGDVKHLIYDSCKMEDGHYELECHRKNGVSNHSELVLAKKNAAGLAAKVGGDQATEQVAVSVSAGEPVDPCPSSSNAVEETNEVLAEASTKGFGHGLEGNNSLNEQDKNGNVDTSGESEIVLDSDAPGNALDLAVDASSCSVPLKLDSVNNPPVISLPQENSHAVATFMHQDSSVSQCEKMLNQDRMSSTLDLQGNKDKNAHKSVSSNDYHQNVTGHSLLNHVESSQILEGYPLTVPANKGMNGDINCGQLSEVQSVLKSERNTDGPYLSQDSYLRKCNSSTSHSSITELPLLSQNVEQTSDHPKTHSRSLSDPEKPCKNGDVKLFGKILSHPSSSQKSNFGSHENEEKGAHNHKQSSKASNVKFSAQHSTDGSAAVLKFDCNNYVGLENVPVRSYGFWDGNRIQTGFSSLPDSAILLAKYPAAFSNYPASSSKMEQQSLQAVVKSNERNLNGVAVLPSREINSSNAVVDYQVYRSREGTKVQPFTVDVKQRQELMFSEMQRRNGFETLPSLQQQGKGMVGVNVVGRGGGILVGGGGGGGSCSGVSDPVAAIRMHYAKNGGQGGSIIREEESWRGKGDIGR